MISDVISEAGRALRFLEPVENDPLLLEDGGLQIRVITGEQELAEWERFSAAHPLARCVYPAYALAGGWSPLRIAHYEGGTLTGGLLVAVRRIGNLPLATSRILCALVGPARHGRMMDRLLVGMERVAVRRRILETEVHLRIPANDAVPGFEWWTEVYEALWRHGYRRLPRVDRSYFVRVDKNDADLLASYSQQTRNRIRKGFKDHSVVESSTDGSLLAKFYEAYEGTIERKAVPTMLPRAIIVHGLVSHVESGRALIFRERYGDVVSNMTIVDTMGTPCVMLASRTKQNVDGEVPSSAQSVHFAAMRALRDRGALWYDFGGCEGPVPVESHPNYGVWHFKHGFRGTYVTFLPHMRKIRGEVTRSILTLLHRYRGDPVSVT